MATSPGTARGTVRAARPAAAASQVAPPAGGAQPAPHYHLGGTELSVGAFETLEDARAAVAARARQWVARYGVEAVEVDEGWASLWRRGVRIDYCVAFSCTIPRCAPRPAGDVRRAA